MMRSLALQAGALLVSQPPAPTGKASAGDMSIWHLARGDVDVGLLDISSTGDSHSARALGEGRRHTAPHLKTMVPLVASLAGPIIVLILQNAHEVRHAGTIALFITARLALVVVLRNPL